jgi:hypothetical protein
MKALLLLIVLSGVTDAVDANAAAYEIELDDGSIVYVGEELEVIVDLEGDEQEVWEGYSADSSWL